MGERNLANCHIKIRPTATFIFKNVADPDTLGQNLALAKTNITRLWVGDTPRLIDEWQIAPPSLGCSEKRGGASRKRASTLLTLQVELRKP